MKNLAIQQPAVCCACCLEKKSLSFATRLLMRGSIISVIFFASLVLSARNLKSQGIDNVTVSVYFKNNTLKEVFKKIEAITDFHFTYRPVDIKSVVNINYKKEEVTVAKLLQDILKGTGLQYVEKDANVIIKKENKPATQQMQTQVAEPTADKIKGKVTNKETGAPIANASVQVKGTNRGTATNSQGEFELDAAVGAALVISSVGFESYEVKIINVANVLVISLNPKVDPLSEVVVTAFGIERQKKSVGYATQKIDGDVLTVARETNVLNSLKGRVAGVQINQSSGGPSGSSYIAIRGNSSLAGNDQPLFVVDGLPVNNENLRKASSFANGDRDYGDGIKDINPDDIESITVLKGANAAALYGSRGANGVILITTKKSTKKGLGISYNSNLTIETINVIPTFQNKWAPGYNDSWGSWPDSTIVNGVKYQVQPDWAEDQWGGLLDGRLAVIQLIPELGPVPMSPQPDDNVRKFYRTGSTITNTVSFTKGSENTNVRLSLSNLSNKGIVPNNSFNRQTINLIASANVTERLKFEAKANYIRETDKNRPNVGRSDQNPFMDLSSIARDIDLNWLKNYKRADGSMLDWINSCCTMNPYWVLNEIQEDDQRDRLISYVSLNYKFTDWLNLQVRASNDGYTDVRNERVAKGTIDRAGRGGNVRNFQYRVNQLNTDAILTASGKLSKNFTGLFLAGANLYKSKTTITGYDGGNLNLDNFYHISNAGIVIPTYSLIRKEVQSVFADAQVGYKNYLFLDITGRNDWSSSLGSPSYFYPSVSLSYVLTDALNIKSNLLSYAKLRASYAQAGNDASPYLTKGGYSVTSQGIYGQPFASISQTVPLATLKNELKKSYEFGTDIRLFNNRVSIDFTYYNASVSNQIIPVPISEATGFTRKVINAGEIENKGIELFVNAIPVQLSNSFTWEASVNFSKNKSKMVSLTPGISNLLLLNYNGVNIEARPGESFGNIVGNPYMRTPEGRKIVGDDGSYSHTSDRKVLGNIQPDWLAGITNTFSYKGIRLSALVDVRKGGQVFSLSKESGMLYGTGKFTENRSNLIADGVVLDPVTNKYIENTQVVDAQTYYAYRAYGPPEITEDFVLDAGYVALREATLSYDFRPKILSKTHFKTVTFSVVGRNILYIYRNPQFKVMGVSPEAAFAPTAAAQGFENTTMPTTRNIGFNLAFSF